MIVGTKELAKQISGVIETYPIENMVVVATDQKHAAIAVLYLQVTFLKVRDYDLTE